MKKLAIWVVVAMAGVWLVHKTDLASYASTLWVKLTKGAKKQVPLDFEFDRIEGEIAKLSDDIEDRIDTSVDQAAVSLLPPGAFPDGVLRVSVTQGAVPLAFYADDNSTVIGSETDIATLVAPGNPAAWDMSTVVGAAFARYVHEAVDYGGGRRILDE